MPEYPAQKRSKEYYPRRRPKNIRVAFPTRPVRSLGAPTSIFNKRMLGVEKKFHDTSNTGVLPLNYAGPVSILVNGIKTGTDYTQRIGRKILLRNVQVRFTCANYQSLTNNSKTLILRLILFIDKQANGNPTPNESQLLENVSGPNVITSPPNVSNESRFKLLFDEVMVIPMTGGNNTLSPQGGGFFKKFLKLNIQQQFIGSGYSAADINTNAMWLFIFSSDDADFNVYTRVRFIDL
jgi:hypothetical protein